MNENDRKKRQWETENKVKVLLILFLTNERKFMESIKDKYGRVIVNRSGCIFCERKHYCGYKIYYGRPADCPKDAETEKHKLKDLHH